jgi:hypothetical protein
VPKRSQMAHEPDAHDMREKATQGNLAGVGIKKPQTQGRPFLQHLPGRGRGGAGGWRPLIFLGGHVEWPVLSAISGQDGLLLDNYRD